MERGPDTGNEVEKSLVVMTMQNQSSRDRMNSEKNRTETVVIIRPDSFF